MVFLSKALFALSALLLGVDAERARHASMMGPPGVPVPDRPTYTPTSPNGTALPPLDTWYYFDQLVDHNDKSKGTFQQRYYFTAEYYTPGGPVIIMTPGEGNADGFDGYLTNRTVNGLIAQALGGATVVIEHRFFGLSNPLPDLTENSLKLLNVQQSAADLAYFAQHAVLPMTGGGALKAPKQAPWILIGGSYSGALTSWTMHAFPGVFWSGYASSAVVEAIQYFWGYFEPIRQYMPKNCTADVEAVISHVDTVFTLGSTSQKNALKAQFGMQNVTHLDDVAGALRYPLWNWQSLSPYSGGAVFYDFCDALEVNNGTVASAKGFGLEHALEAWGVYMISLLNDDCGGDINDDCLGTYDPTLSYYSDTSVDNANRSWLWFCCNYFGYWQDGAPVGWPSLVTRLVGPSYDNRQCSYWFPETFPSGKASPKDSQINSQYGGWQVETDRLFFANGHRDPWRESTVSSDFIYRASTPSTPIMIGDGFHCSDLITKSGTVDATILKVQNTAVAYFTKWHAQWHSTIGKGKRAFDDELVGRMNAVINAAGMPVEERDESTIPESVVNAEPAAVPAAIANAGTSSAPARAGAKHILHNGFNGATVSLN